jgi:hypothetical protein
MLPGLGVFVGESVTPGSQVFTTAGLTSFTIPNFNTMTVEVWGGGGSGGMAYNGNTTSQGGQGGSYVKYLIAPAQILIGTAYSVYIGSGGGSTTSGGGAGYPGTYSYFADAIWAIGGYGGRGQNASATSASTYTPAVSVPWSLVVSETGGVGGYGTVGGSVTYAGGGGGGGQNTGGVTKAGGTSTYGGAGGQGGYNSATSLPGIQPGGGGGGGNGGGYGFTNGVGGTGKVLISWS